MPKLDKKTGRLARMSKEEVLAKLKEETQARREAGEDAGPMLEPSEIPVPLIAYDPDLDPDLTENSATSADALTDFTSSWRKLLAENFCHKVGFKVESGAQNVARLVTVVMISGEEMELMVQPGETVRALADRLALIRGVARVRLLVDHAPLPEDVLVLDCVPHAYVVTAVLQFGLDFPNRLDPIVEQQIRISCELHGAGPASCGKQVDPEAFWIAAFEKPNWKAFARHIGTQDFQITVFSFGVNPLKKTRFIYYNFGMGDNGFGSVHDENESRATASFDDGHFEMLVGAPRGFLNGLEAAAKAKDGVEKYGAF